MSYLDLLRESAAKAGNITCMGLDPVMSAIPARYGEGTDRVKEFLYDVLNRMAQQQVSPGAFKPNEGFYRVLDRPRLGDYTGTDTLAEVMDMLNTGFSGIPIILDSKRGDIDRSSTNYAEDAFNGWQADALTVSGYMGTDSVMPFAKLDAAHNKGVYVLVRTSNAGAHDLQNLRVANGYPLYMMVASLVGEWASANQGVGAVVGATAQSELHDIASMYAKNSLQVPLLIPGVGSQGGSASEVIATLKDIGYDPSLARINSSSGLTHPWKTADKAPDDCAKACIEKVLQMNEQCRYA